MREKRADKEQVNLITLRQWIKEVHQSFTFEKSLLNRNEIDSVYDAWFG